MHEKYQFSILGVRFAKDSNGKGGSPPGIQARFYIIQYQPEQKQLYCAVQQGVSALLYFLAF